jgi:CTD kinase subunit beta
LNGHDRGSEVAATAWKVSIDLYRTLAPLKMGTGVMAFACLELAERLHPETFAESRQEDTERRYKRFGIRREQVVETLLDLLDVYTSYRTSTALGQGQASKPLEKFLNVRIPLNEESASRRLPRYTEYVEREGLRGVEDAGGYGRSVNGNGLANGGSSGRSSKNTSPKDGVGVALSPGGSLSVPGTGGSGSTVATGVSSLAGAQGAGAGGGRVGQRAGDRGRDGTVRFMLNPEREREERKAVAEYDLR